MYTDRDTYQILENAFAGLAPAACLAIALRASLRALPLLLLRSSSEKKLGVSIKPFDYWSDDQITPYLLATLSAQGLAMRLLRPCSPEYATAVGPVFEQLKKAIYKASSSLDSARRRAYSNEYLFPDTCGRAYTASTFCAGAVIGSIYTNLESAGDLQSNFERAAEKREKLTEYAKDVDALYAQLTAAEKAAKENNFAEEKTKVTAFAINETNTLSKRFTRHADTIAHILTVNQNDALKEFHVAAQAAAEAFQVVCDSLSLPIDERLPLTLENALSAAARYEDARIATLHLGQEINFDLFIEAPHRSFTLLKTLLLNPTELVAKINSCILCAEKIKEGFSGAIQAPHAQNLLADFEEYDCAFSGFDEFIGFALQPDGSELSSALASLYYFSSPAKLSDIRDADTWTYDSHIAASSVEAISYTLAGFHVDVKGFSKYDIYPFRELSLAAVLNDLDFLKQGSIHQLFTRRLWSPPSPTHAAYEHSPPASLYSNATTLWHVLWKDLKRDAASVEPSLHPWLNWYDGLFMRGAMDLPLLEALIATSYPQQQEAAFS